MKKLVFTLIYLLPVFTSQAMIITVDDNGSADFDNIQDAIDNSGVGDTIVVKPGTYNRRIFFNNKSITLTSEDPNDPDIVESTIITADSGYSVSFDFAEDHRSVLTGFTITGGGINCFDGTSPTISKNVIRNCGGDGIRGEEDNAEPVISDNTISSNTGHGIYKCNGPIKNNIISENNIGGIAYCDGQISNNIISANMFVLNSPGGGGLSYCKGKIVGNQIEYNYTNQKGGACYECSGNITGNRIIGNVSRIAGGALSNCRGYISNNIIAGNRSGNGGGIFSCYQIYNNTIVGNIAEENGGALSQSGDISNNIIAFNSASFVGGINGAGTSSYNAFWSNDGGNFGGGVTRGPGDIITEPLFVSNGYWDNNETPDESDDFWVDGDYHVTSQAGRWSPVDRRWVKDSLTSPCIDAGGEPDDPNSDWTAELWPHGRRINIGAYGGTVQASMSLSNAGNIADLNPDVNDANDWVDYNDMLLLAGKWLSNELTLAEDLDRNGTVNFADYAILVNNFQPKIQPPQPPVPDPMTWQTEPYAISRTAIEMTATFAASSDDSGVEYYFQSLSLGGHDSGWRDEPNYTDTGLTVGTEYSYIVKARNKANLIETASSGLRSAITFPEDNTPPGPDPATWNTEPYVVSAGSIRMVATTASDESGVEYFFACSSNAVYSSNWQDSPVYQVNSLPKNTYSFIVRVRDKSPNRNTTGDSAQITIDLQPPTPDPMQWESEPKEVYHGGGLQDYWAEMTAAEATDLSGGVQYYFECSDSRYSSGGAGDPGGTKWRTERTYEVRMGQSGRYFYFRVKARDVYGNETAFSSELPAI